MGLGGFSDIPRFQGSVPQPWLMPVPRWGTIEMMVFRKSPKGICQ
ncbi:hypothetical protein SCARR_02798 [Pontiella sulfatireligans]|uniref:Uncharacterized protein n=1 Tax=Pontiella sulfatireligans TaxID=2750658 RepID=A0A6C2UN73_9BACT|nr:hypothetical protein SCARR_02798 [Pontiella sulfatireligans]